MPPACFFRPPYADFQPEMNHESVAAREETARAPREFIRAKAASRGRWSAPWLNCPPGTISCEKACFIV